MSKNNIHYDWSVVDGYKCPIKIVVGRRGLGKTFPKVKKSLENYITKRRRFIYVVETGEMIKELSRNNGEKFWAKILEYYGKKDTSRKRYFYSKITSCELEENNEVITSNTKVIGSTIVVNKETAGYIIDLNAFGELKRNNFVGVTDVIIDEFISEKMDKTTLDYPRRISSIIQSIARLDNINIYMLGNSIRLDDPILSRMGFKIRKYGIYKKYDENGLLAVLHFVDPGDYPEFAEKHSKSVAGRFAKMLGETNEEENKFIENLPQDKRLIMPVKYRKGGFSVNIVRGDILVTIKELQTGGFACIPFSYNNVKTLFCMTEKEQGYKLGYHIICNKSLRQTLINMIRADVLHYYSEVEYVQLKEIIKGE